MDAAGFFVLNRKNADYDRNIRQMLMLLRNQGLSVSQPFGSGVDGSANPVLLTSFDGDAVQKVNPKMIEEMAKMLADIHNVQVEEHSLFRKHDFIAYF